MKTARQILPIVKKGLLKDIENGANDLEYWLSKTPNERAAAITFLVMNSIKPGTRMDRTHVVVIKPGRDKGIADIKSLKKGGPEKSK